MKVRRTVYTSIVMLFANSMLGQVSSAQIANDYAIGERGENFAVYAKTTASTNQEGRVASITNQFTLLENALHYRDESGEWQGSEDLVESFEGGAVARRGPVKASFSSDVKSETVWDLQSSDGTRRRTCNRGHRLGQRQAYHSWYCQIGPGRSGAAQSGRLALVL